jgi:hypothetical protein
VGQYHKEMRVLMTIALILAAAGVVDNFYCDGRYRRAVLEEVNAQGQQFRYQVDLIVGNLVGH